MPENTAPSVSGGIRRFRLFRPLTERNFLLLWAGEGVSVFGNHFEALALTWVILDILKAPGLALGTVMMASAIPRAVFMLFGGVLSDRLSPRLVMLVSNAGGTLPAGRRAGDTCFRPHQRSLHTGALASLPVFGNLRGSRRFLFTSHDEHGAKVA